MIFAQIDPVATSVRQNGPFSTTTVTGSYMTATARPYILGETPVRFEVQFGDVVLDANQSVTDFKQVLSTQVTLTAAQLANWGTDDAVVLRTIATQVSTTVKEIVSGSINGPRF